MNNATPINILQERSSGILLPIFSLPGTHGIGDLGRSTREFIDFLKKSGQSCWQILPIGPTSSIFGNSPYMSYSAFAGSPLLISLDILTELQLVRDEEIECQSFSEYIVDYQEVTQYKQRALAFAWKRFRERATTNTILEEFANQNPWCLDYGLFLALKQQYQETPWYAWPEALRRRKPKALVQARKEHHPVIQYYLFEQYLFSTQWRRFHNYAKENGITIIGDLPIYVALDSADVWSNQEIFQLDLKTGLPTYVAGVPPDYFSSNGQRWGNPLYRWQANNSEVEWQLWSWWEQRLRRNFFLADTLRLDHFRGFESYWSVPAEEETALNGRWQKGPGLPFFNEMSYRIGNMSIIAEDLGLITPEVEMLRRSLGYPGMKILLFAFDGDADNTYLPYNMEKNSVVYTGTHDNDTAVGWFLSSNVAMESKLQAKRFANRMDDNAGSFHKDLIHLALSSPANLSILPMQDILGFGNDCRLNIPGTTMNNWQWRCAQRFINDDIAAWFADLTRLFGRLPPVQPDNENYLNPNKAKSDGSD